MSDSMIERVAIAIATADLDNNPADGVFDFYALTGEIAEKYYSLARAAIEAMRHPTPAMNSALTEALERWFGEIGDDGDVYQAAIDAALKD